MTKRIEAPHIDEPVAHPGLSDSGSGTLILMGGGIEPGHEAFQHFLRLADAQNSAPIVGLTTASAEPVETGTAWLADFRRAGATDVRIPTFRRALDDRDAEIAAMIRSAHA